MDAQDKISKLENELEQLEKQKILLENREKRQERKARTRQLILLGAEICSRLHIRSPSDEQIRLIADFISDQERRGSYVSKFMNQREE